jgi:hypothetical protein
MSIMCYNIPIFEFLIEKVLNLYNDKNTYKMHIKSLQRIG